MKKLKVLLSILVVLIITVSSSTSTLSLTIVSSSDVISDDLKKAIIERKDDVVSVYIFLKDFDKSKINSRLEKKYSYNTKAYENPNLYYTEIVPNIAIENNTVSDFLENEIATPSLLSLNNKKSTLTYETRKMINIAMVNDMNKYLERYREEVSDAVGNYVSNFLDDNERLIEKVIVQPRGGEFIIAEVNLTNVKEIAKSPYVSRVSLYQDFIFEPCGWNATSTTHSDYDTGLGSDLYNYGSGYDGTGVRIGVIEAEFGRYDANNYNLTDADLTYLFPPGVNVSTIKNHATEITSLICGKKVNIDGKKYGGLATGATVYQTGIYYLQQIYDTIDMMIYDYNVNVINMSMGLPYYENYISSYGEYQATIDNLIENNRVTIVLAAGNASDDNPGRVITAPSNAYNAIVVGNLATKYYDVILEPPFPMNTTSCYYESDYLPNKPDVVAPGSSVKLPTSSSTTGAHLMGTSISAPIVTGIVAQLMQDNVFAISNPNATKNFIVCGADSNIVNDNSISYGALKDMSGAGLVNAVNSFEIADSDTQSNYYGVYFASQSVPTEYETIATFNLAKGDNLRTVLTFEKEEMINLTQEYGNNIDIRLVRNNPYSTYCIASESTNNNVELIDTKVPTTGTYWLQIRLTDSILDSTSNNDLHYWVSWRLY